MGTTKTTINLGWIDLTEDGVTERMVSLDDLANVLAALPDETLRGDLASLIQRIRNAEEQPSENQRRLR